MATEKSEKVVYVEKDLLPYLEEEECKPELVTLNIPPACATKHVAAGIPCDLCTLRIKAFESCIKHKEDYLSYLEAWQNAYLDYLSRDLD